MGLAAAAASVALGYAATAAAQITPSPLNDDPPPTPPKVTSTEAAQATAAEQRDARKLATAVFAKPAAAARAADKADAANQPDFNRIEPKPEWSAQSGPQISGKGVEIKTPF